MKHNFKKYLIVLLALILCLGMLLAGCNPDDDNPTPPVGTKIKILSDLVNLGDKQSDYAPSAVNYASNVSAEQANKLLVKQNTEKAEHNYVETAEGGYTNFDYEKGEYNWIVDGEDTATFTKIFLFSNVNDLIGRMAAAALPQDKMIKLVSYITRQDPAGQDYLLTAGVGSAIRDYEELDELYDLYDEDDSDDNYRLLQKKRRKVMHEVFGIFENDAAAASRTAIEILAYSQKVVAEIMIPDYADKKAVSAPSFTEFFKVELFDYDTLVYLRSFNETCGAAGSEYLIANVSYNIPASNKKEMTKLYGYYYQYQKREFDLFTDTEYFEYLELGLKDYFDTNEQALKYRDYDRKHYEGAYRYSADFYKKYYETHFRFQAKQESHDEKVYDVVKTWTTSYAYEMQRGCEIGMEATLKISDVNWEYTGVDSNVTNYNKAAKDYYSISETDRDNKTNPANIAFVKLRVEQLKSQHNTVTHKTITAADLANALKYQIYSFSGDYSRTMLSNRKDTIYMTEEYNRLDALDTIARAEKLDEIGRNDAMFDNHKYFYIEKGNITHQINIAANYNWTKIAEGMATTIAYNYDYYHNKNISGIDSEVINGVTVYYTESVDIKFEDTLIKKKIVQDGNSTAKNKKEYDTDWEISRLLDNHENVFRYAYGQIVVQYMDASDLQNYALNGNFASSIKPGKNLDDPNSNSFNDSSLQAISTSNLNAFITRANNYTNYTEENYNTDDRIELARYVSGKWEGILPSNGNVNGKPAVYTFTKSEMVGSTQREFDYHLIFEGWYLDKNLQYKAKLENGRFGEKYNYDIRLYPGYKVIKTPVAK